MNDLKGKKVTNVYILNEEEINKINCLKIIIKGFFKTLYDEKFSKFLLSSAFLYMVYVGIVEEYYIVSILYGIAYLKFTNFKEAYDFSKSFLNEYKEIKERFSEDILIEGANVYDELSSNYIDNNLIT